MSRIPVAVVGATGAVGQALVAALHGHPWFTVEALVASERSAGLKYRDAVRWVLPGSVPPEVADRTILDVTADLQTPIILSCIDAGLARELEPQWAQRGHRVFSNASAFRLHPTVPLLIPEVNADHYALVQYRDSAWKGLIVTNPNCCVAGLAMALGPLTKRWSLERVYVTTFQAVSGAGLQGLAALPIADNVIPWIAGEEEKLQKEPPKILGWLQGARVVEYPVEIIPSCYRVPVRHGHTLALVIEGDADMTPERAAEAWRDFRPPDWVRQLPSGVGQPIRVWTEVDRPQPALDRDEGQGMVVHVGRIRGQAGRVLCTVLVHNLIRGAAGAVLLNAELSVSLNPL
jgi:aspartate-semialdehyde dehydrogenase